MINPTLHTVHTTPWPPDVYKRQIQDILDGTVRESHSDYPTVVRNHNGASFLPDQLLERYLSRLPLKGFPYEDAVAMCDVYAAAGRMGVHPL